MGQTSGARFGDLAVLLGFTAAGDETTELAVTLFWQAIAASEAPYTVSVQLLDSSGMLVAQQDQQPGAGAYPTTGWAPGEVLADSYRIARPPGLAPGSYTLIVKVYDPMNNATLPVVLPGEIARGDALRLDTIEFD
jgi:hypothetical protein